MRERIVRFLESENLSSARFADDIGVQRSTVSHVLSGRNNPSFDFIQRILSKYKYINAEWLIMGTGNMLKSVVQRNLFENNIQESIISEINPKNPDKLDSNSDNIHIKEKSIINEENNISNEKLERINDNSVEKIITIYADKTFDIYLPAK